MRVKRLRVNKIGLAGVFSSYIAAIPILQYYKSPLSAFNLATFLAVFFFFVFIIETFKRGTSVFIVEKHLLPVRLYIYYLTINIVVTSLYFNRSFSWSNMDSYFRMLLLFVSLIILGHKYFDFKESLRTLGNILVVCSFLIMFQFVLYYVFSFATTITISKLLTEPNYAVPTNRFSGFYMEPAHYSQSAILYLCLEIFKENKDLNKTLSWKIAVVVAGIVLSGSGQGYLMLVLLFMFWLCVSFRRKTITKKQFIILFSLVILVPIGLILLSRISFFSGAISRIISDDGILNSQAVLGRTYTNFFFDRLDMPVKWIGVGFGHEYDVVSRGLYINSLYSHLIQCGYTWIPMMIFILMYLFHYGKLNIKLFVPLFALTLYFASTASPMILSFYLLYMLPNSLKSEYKKTEFDKNIQSVQGGDLDE